MNKYGLVVFLLFKLAELKTILLYFVDFAFTSSKLLPSDLASRWFNDNMNLDRVLAPAVFVLQFIIDATLKIIFFTVLVSSFNKKYKFRILPKIH